MTAPEWGWQDVAILAFVSICIVAMAIWLASPAKPDELERDEHEEGISG